MHQLEQQSHLCKDHLLFSEIYHACWCDILFKIAAPQTTRAKVCLQTAQTILLGPIQVATSLTHTRPEVINKLLHPITSIHLPENSWWECSKFFLIILKILWTNLKENGWKPEGRINNQIPVAQLKGFSKLEYFHPLWMGFCSIVGNTRHPPSLPLLCHISHTVGR